MKHLLSTILCYGMISASFAQWPNPNYTVYKNGPDLTMNNIPADECVVGNCSACDPPVSVGNWTLRDFFYSGTGVSGKTLVCDFTGARTIFESYTDNSWFSSFSLGCACWNCDFTGSTTVSNPIINWYIAAVGGVPFKNGLFITENLEETTTFYASVVDEAGCESDREPVTGTINDITPAEIGDDITLCLNGGSYDLEQDT